MSARGAREFCRWLGAKTGREYRLPTVAEWRRAAAAGSAGRWCAGDDPAALAEWAWFEANSGGTTHPVARKRANAWGLHDVHGNAGEWCTELDSEGKARAVLCGGSFTDDAEGIATASLRRPDPSWQMSDPQLPKSRWWLSDGPFVGFRLVRKP
jgi:formylglycine-generating enzyme required for sulfatase activity